MPSSSITVRVQGLTELRRGLQAIDKNADKELASALGQVGAGIAQNIRAAMPHKTGAAASTVASHVKLRGVSISIGTGRSDDYVPWLDFGGHVGIRNSISRPFIRGGRYLYPQIEAARARTVAAINIAIAKAARRAGFTVSGA